MLVPLHLLRVMFFLVCHMPDTLLIMDWRCTSMLNSGTRVLHLVDKYASHRARLFRAHMLAITTEYALRTSRALEVAHSLHRICAEFFRPKCRAGKLQRSFVPKNCLQVSILFKTCQVFWAMLNCPYFKPHFDYLTPFVYLLV